jgi:hypothetical protein
MEAPMNSKTGKLVETPVYRGRYVRGSFNWADFSEEDRVSFTMAKLMNELSDEDRAKWSMVV